MLPIKAGISLRRERWRSGWSEKDMSLLPSAEVKKFVKLHFLCMGDINCFKKSITSE